jgi:GNAT superfamily N-acetyltransferase
MTVTVADPAVHEEILDLTYPLWGEGLTRQAYGTWNRGQMSTPWGRTHLERVALVDAGQVLSSAKRYHFDAMVSGVHEHVVGIGAVFTPPASRGQGHARVLIEEMLSQAARAGAGWVLLFSEIGDAYYKGMRFAPLPRTMLTLMVKVDERRGAPATFVRGGETADLPFIAELSAVYAHGAGVALDRTADLIGFGIARRRLLAGLGPAGLRHLEFFVAEEGGRPAAYVVISRGPSGVVLEECGDRDPSGARVGAILQVLLAREPSILQEPMRAWLPAGFRPPQVLVVDETPAAETMMMRRLGPAESSAATPPAPVTYWQTDVF